MKIELKGKCNKYDACILEIEDNSIVEIVCEDIRKKEDLIELITGTRVEGGVCVLGDLDTKNCLKEYRKKVDIVDMERLNSTLSVRNYLTFYMMVSGLYCDNTVEEIEKIFCQMKINNCLENSLDELSKEEKIKVRCMAAYMKKVQCLVGKDLPESLESAQVENVMTFLKQYFRSQNRFCLLIGSANRKLKNVDAVYII